MKLYCNNFKLCFNYLKFIHKFLYNNKYLIELIDLKTKIYFLNN